MKILCICEEGYKRSVITRRLLIYKHHDAVAMGLNNSIELRNLLSEWADVILLAEAWMKKEIDPLFHGKIESQYDIGPDHYQPTLTDRRLVREVTKKLKELKYL